MNCWMIIGGLAGVFLVIAYVGVLLERAYDAGFRDGRLCGRAEGKAVSK